MLLTVVSDPLSVLRPIDFLLVEILSRAFNLDARS